MSVVFNHVAIIGGGLIGSSIARAARDYAGVKMITMIDTSDSVRGAIDRLGIADAVLAAPSPALAAADIVILAVPPARITQAAQEALPFMRDWAILSDVGSVKKNIIDAVTPLLPPTIDFVPGHPIAGTEFNGPEAGFADLFKNRWCILTPQDEDSEATQNVKSFWEAMGSDVAIMDANRHDIVLATTSHLPHLIAYTLVGTAVDMEAVTRKEVVKFSAGGFRDFTRIAASDPVMWRDVFLANRESVLDVVDRFIEDLSALKRAIRWDDGDTLFQHFSKTRDIRKRIVDAGQDSEAPDFGRGSDGH